MRAIDADKAIEVAQIKYNDWNLAMAAADGRREINLCFKKQELFKAVKAVLACVPTLTPPNEPLTLEQLREMDGEPVWGKSLITDKPGEWFIVRVVEMSKAWFIACAGATQGFGDKDTYGTTWLAYRRPPEGEADE